MELVPAYVQDFRVDDDRHDREVCIPMNGLAEVTDAMGEVLRGLVRGHRRSVRVRQHS